VVASGMLVWKPWQPPALASVTENSIGVIDPDRGEIIGQIHVGTQPGGIAIGEGYAWVTNTGADTVSQIDLTTRSVINRIKVGRSPTGIVIAKDSVWVTNSGERSVSRISVANGDVVDTIDVGNGPTAVVAGGDWLWVANATDSTVVRLDAESGEVGQPVPVAARPVALVADEKGVWVAGEDDAAISHIDPTRGVALAAPIQLTARPSALALDSDAVWVAASDGTLTRIDRQTNRVTAVDVGGKLDAIVIGADSIWVGDRDGFVYRLNRSAPDSSPPARIATVSAVEALAFVDGDVWVAAQTAVANHYGGTLNVVDPFRFELDPLAYGNGGGNDVAPLEADGLVAYRRVGGSAGSALLPDLAVSIPRATEGGLTYTFQLRPNLVYSTGEPVRVADFRRAVERAYTVGVHGTSPNTYFGRISGTEACQDEHVERCDMSKGILTDEGTRTVSFKLSEPDPDFLYKLAAPAAYPVPERVPMHGYVDMSFPGTGPYVVTVANDKEIRLDRNPHFEVWDAAVRPDGFPDAIVIRVVEDTARSVSMVQNVEADYLQYRAREASPALFDKVKTQYGGQLHVGSIGTWLVLMNTRVAPFDNADARKAVNFALDRLRVTDLYGGPPLVNPSCQILPPGFLGYQPYCPYTREPDQGGRWRGTDLAEARRLVEASGTKGAHVVVGPTYLRNAAPLLDYLGEVLVDLGYIVSVDHGNFDDWVEETNAGRIQFEPLGWGPDFGAPSNYFSMFTCKGTFEPINYCDKEFDHAFNAALDLQTTDPAAAWRAWAALDKSVVDLGLAAPLYVVGGDFVSARVGNYQFNPVYGVLLDQMWVQSSSTGRPPAPSLPPAPSTPPNPLVGTWLAPVVTCAQEIAVIESAGYTADQVTSSGFDPTCAAGNIGTQARNTNRYSLVFDGLPAAATFRSMRTFDYGAFNSPHDYSLTGDTTFELGGRDGSVWDYCLTFKFAIDGDQLTVDMVDPRCPGTGEAPLQDQIALTAIFETSSFTRQP
jgi:peptide/nickel transport system substrate-binding protein